jgi:hypothetical protein
LSELHVVRRRATAALPPQTLDAEPEELSEESAKIDDMALRQRILQRLALVTESDYFTLLGVPRRATGNDVESAYGRLKGEFARERILTPTTADLSDDVDTIHEVLDEAYEILSDQVRRERYRSALDATISGPR